MASRFLFQKFSDGMSRSTSLLGTHVSVSSRAATVHGTLGNVLHGSAVHLPGMTVLINHGIHGYATKYFKQTFSSSASKQAQDAARKPEIPLRTRQLLPWMWPSKRRRIALDVDTTKTLITLNGFAWFYILSSDDNAGSNKGSRCNCQCHGSNVKQD